MRGGIKEIFRKINKFNLCWFLSFSSSAEKAELVMS